jgi:hypothetical protein
MLIASTNLGRSTSWRNLYLNAAILSAALEPLFFEVRKK